MLSSVMAFTSTARAKVSIFKGNIHIVIVISVPIASSVQQLSSQLLESAIESSAQMSIHFQTESTWKFKHILTVKHILTSCHIATFITSVSRCAFIKRKLICSQQWIWSCSCEFSYQHWFLAQAVLSRVMGKSMSAEWMWRKSVSKGTERCDFIDVPSTVTRKQDQSWTDLANISISCRYWSRLNLSRAQLTQEGIEGDASFRLEAMDHFSFS